MDKFLLSHSINTTTPLYGGKYPLIKKVSSIKNGDTVNETIINTTVHMGTHIDLPYHFYEEGQTLKDFPIEFWFFKKILFVEFVPENTIIENDLIKILEANIDIGYDLLIVKTGMGKFRNEEKYWAEGYGFSPNVYIYLKKNFPNIKVMGFDLISVTSYLNRALGKDAHRTFLNPTSPILLLEDMNLSKVTIENIPSKIIIAPLFIDDCDGLPCSVFAYN